MRKLAWHFSRTFLWSAFALLLLLALGTVAGRLLIHKIDDYRLELAQELGQQLGGVVHIERLEGRWEGAYPIIQVAGVQVDPYREPRMLGVGQSTEEVLLPSLALDQLQLQVDGWQSLKNWQPVIRQLKIQGVRLRMEQWESGALTLAGFTHEPQTPAAVEHPPEVGTSIWQQLLAPLMLQQRVQVQDVELKVLSRSGATRWLSVPFLEYRGGGWKQQLRAEIRLDENDPIRLSLKRQGDPSRLEPANLSAYLDWPQQPLALWMELFPGAEPIVRLDAGGELWLNHLAGQWQVQGNLSVPNIDLALPEELPLPRMANLSTQIALRVQDAEHWELWLESLQGRLEGVELTPKPLYLRGSPEGIQVAIERILIEPLADFAKAYAGLPEGVKSLLFSLNPRGTLSQVSLFVDPTQPEAFELSAQVKDVAVDAWESAPSASGVSGQLQLRGRQGRFQLASSNFSLGLTELFDEAWHWSKGSGELFWFIEHERFSLLGRELKVTAPVGQVVGELRLDFPFDDDRPDEMGLLLGIRDADATLAERYVPSKILSPELDGWLDEAIQAGTVSDGIFLYNGAISSVEHDSARSYDMYYRVQEGVLDYAPEWPKLEQLSALIKVTNDRVDVQADGAHLLDHGELNEAHVWFDGDDQPLRLQVQGSLNAQGGDGYKILTESPLNELLDGAADGWRLDGALQVALDLAIGLEASVEDLLHVEVDLQDMQLYIDQADLTLSALEGSVTYNSVNGLSSKDLKGELLGQPGRFTISGREGGRYTRIEASSQVNARTLEDWQGFDWLAMAKGQSAYQAVLDILPDRPPRLKIQTNLRGMALDLPLDFSKGARSTRASHIGMTLANPLRVDFSLGQSLHGLFQITSEGQLQRGRVRLGSKGRLTFPAKGLQVDGRLGVVSIPALERWYQQAGWLKKEVTQESIESAALPALSINSLQIAELQLGEGYAFKPVTLTAVPAGDGYRAKVDSPNLAGSLWYPGSHRRWQLNLSRVYLPETNTIGQTEVSGSHVDPLVDINPSEFPPLALSIDELRLGKQPLGSLSTELRPHAKGVHFSNIDLQMPDLSVEGEISWNYEKRLHGTTSKLQLRSEDITQLLDNWGYAAGAQASESKLDLDLYWPASPLGVSMASVASVRGTMAMKMKKGRFVELDRKANVLKVFGVLNFGSITRRLRLDFSDLFEGGIAFDKVTALMQIEKGRVSTKEPLIIDGLSSTFRMSGWYDLVNNKTDMRLAVTLPVTQNLPVIALLMGLPQVGGAIFLADKLLGDSVQSFASVRYHISGSLDDPDVVFDQAFTNKTD